MSDSWSIKHTESERYAAGAEMAKRAGDVGEAQRLYALAAIYEMIASRQLSPTKNRTLGITAVSAVSLLCKAGRLEKAEQWASEWMDHVPHFARKQLQTIIQTIRVNPEAEREAP